MTYIFLFIAFDRLQPRWRRVRPRAEQGAAQEVAPNPAPEPAPEDLPAPALEDKPRFMHNLFIMLFYYT
jgi:hypothetical protein